MHSKHSQKKDLFKRLHVRFAMFAQMISLDVFEAIFCVSEGTIPSGLAEKSEDSLAQKSERRISREVCEGTGRPLGKSR